MKKCINCGGEIPNERDVCEECVDKVLKGGIQNARISKREIGKAKKER